MSIVVASVLDGFMFRISYKEQMSQEDGKQFFSFMFSSKIINTEFNFCIVEKRLVEKCITLTTEEYDRLKSVEASEKAAKDKPALCKVFGRMCTPKEEPFRNLEEGAPVDIPDGRTLSISYTGFRRRTKDVLFSFMFKEEICSWMAQADHEEKQQEQQKVNSNTSVTSKGIRKRLNNYNSNSDTTDLDE